MRMTSEYVAADCAVSLQRSRATTSKSHTERESHADQVADGVEGEAYCTLYTVEPERELLNLKRREHAGPGYR